MKTSWKYTLAFLLAGLTLSVVSAISREVGIEQGRKQMLCEIADRMGTLADLPINCRAALDKLGFEIREKSK